VRAHLWHHAQRLAVVRHAVHCPEPQRVVRADFLAQRLWADQQLPVLMPRSHGSQPVRWRAVGSRVGHAAAWLGQPGALSPGDRAVERLAARSPAHHWFPPDAVPLRVVPIELTAVVMVAMIFALMARVLKVAQRLPDSGRQPACPVANPEYPAGRLRCCLPPESKRPGYRLSAGARAGLVGPVASEAVGCAASVYRAVGAAVPVCNGVPAGSFPDLGGGRRYQHRPAPRTDQAYPVAARPILFPRPAAHRRRWRVRRCLSRHRPVG
jgi:hypothetical protein